MLREEFVLDAAGVFEPALSGGCPAHPLPPPGDLLGAGALLFMASDLFPARWSSSSGKMTRRALNLLPSHVGAFYSGYALDQFDLDVFLACVLQDRGRERPAAGSMRDFLRFIGRRPTLSRIARMELSLIRLTKAMVELDDWRFGCCVPLLESVLVDRASAVCRVKVSTEALESLGRRDGLGALVRLRCGLGPRPMEKWLAGLLWVLGGETCLIDLERLRLLCGRHAADHRVFTRQILSSLDTLADSGYVICVQHRRDHSIVVSRNQGKKSATVCQLVW